MPAPPHPDPDPRLSISGTQVATTRLALIARIRAFCIHLGISLSIATLLVVAVCYIWYPSALFSLAKGREIFLLVLGCDIVLGPVLTLVVFNIMKARRELARDIAIIAIVQFWAMIYGVQTLLQARPAYIVYNAGQFNIPLANEIVGDGGKASPAETPSAPWFGPRLVGSRLPQDADEHSRLLFSAVDGRGDVFDMPKYFVPYDEVRSEVVARAQTPEQISRYLRLAPAVVANLALAHSKGHPEIGVLPVVIRKTLAIGTVDLRTGELLGIDAVPAGH